MPEFLQAFLLIFSNLLAASHQGIDDSIENVFNSRWFGCAASWPSILSSIGTGIHGFY